MDIKTVIAEVLKNRHKKVPALEKVGQELQDLSNRLDEVRRMAASVLDESIEASQEMRNATKSLAVGIDSVQENVTDLSEKLRNVTERFRKDTINIGIAGASGQGKSTLLQHISGLSDREIPTSSGLACTGAKSKIYHYEGDPYGRIDFYSEEEMLQEIIAPKYERLRFPKLFSLHEFQKPLPELQPEELLERNLDTAHYENLKKVHEAFPVFRNLLSTTRTIDLTEIPEYVTQRNQNYLAVRTANVFVTFPNQDVGGLCLVDLPGLEAEQDHAAKIITSLKRELDAMIFLKMPRSERAIWEENDFKVINLVEKAIEELDLADWLFLVFNQREDGLNTEQIKLLREKPLTRYSTPNIITANCKNPQEVQEKIFAVILKHLKQNLDRIDQQYLEALGKKIELMVRELTAAVTPVFPLLSVQQVDLEIDNAFEDRLNEFMENLTDQLERLVEKVHDVAYLTNIQDTFLAKVKEVCDEAEQSPPVASLEELKRRSVRKRGWPSVVQEDLNYLRVHLAKYLASGLDVYLENMVDGVYQEVLINILTESLLKLLSKESVAEGPRGQLEEFYKLLDPKWQPRLMAGFRYMLAFAFSYHSHFHHRVRQEMKPLDPMVYNFVKEIIPDDLLENSDEENAESIYRGLESKYQEAVYQVRRRFMDEMKNDPSNAIFALIEEIRDRLAFEKGVDREWRHFLKVRKGLVWPEVFGEIDLKIGRQQHWQTVLNDLLAKGKSLQHLLL